MYNYSAEKPKILTDEGQIEFLKVRDLAKKLLREAGCFKMFSALKGLTGNTWTMMAYVDRMVEIGELHEIIYGDVAGQDRIFVEAK